MTGAPNTLAHTHAAILSIGDELTIGQTVDTNSAWLSARLLEMGIKPVEHATVPDDLEAIRAAMLRLSRLAPLVVSTGGLGPTDDDLTRPALAAAMGEELVEDEAALRGLEERFRRIGRELLDANRVQAQRPRSARCLSNELGTAPGLSARVRHGEAACDVFCLPGPPGEMRAVFRGAVAPALSPPGGRVILVRTLHEFGLPESALPGLLGGLMERDRNPVVGTSAAIGVVSCRIRYEGAADGAGRAVDEAERRVRAALDPFVFGSGDDTLASSVVDLARFRGETIATAESCTGGLMAQMLTERAGSSDVFAGGWVTYSNAMKMSELSVPAETIERHGAVSAETARAMALGALERSTHAGAPATHAAAISGIAGPSGGSVEKPVGTVFIARATRGDEAVDVRQFRFPDGRSSVRERSALAALMMLRLQMIERLDVRILWEQHEQ